MNNRSEYRSPVILVLVVDPGTFAPLIARTGACQGLPAARHAREDRLLDPGRPGCCDIEGAAVMTPLLAECRVWITTGRKKYRA